MKIAFLFPGQNSQVVGMGRELCDAYPGVKAKYFDRADEILGFSISRLCFEGPEEELVKTENQQPAIFLVSAATNAVLRERGLDPAGMAGHSLGEYSALVASGALPFEKGLRLTRRRGELMAGVAAQTGGIMAAVLGLTPDVVEEVCREVKPLGVAEIANYNSPHQTVISGEEEAVQRAMELCRERGARRIVQLNVSAPFHCSLMAPLESTFGPVLDEATIGEPSVPIVANVTAEYERSPDEIRRNLMTQLARPVRWTASIQRLMADGFDRFVEVGPGHVLTGLTRQIDKSAAASSTEDPAAIEKVLADSGVYAA